MKKIFVFLALILISVTSFAESYSEKPDYDGKLTYSIGAGVCANLDGDVGPTIFTSLKYNMLMAGIAVSHPLTSSGGGLKLAGSNATHWMIGLNFGEKTNFSIFAGPSRRQTYKNGNDYKMGFNFGTHIRFGRHCSGFIYGSSFGDTPFDYSGEFGLGMTFDISWLTF